MITFHSPNPATRDAGRETRAHAHTGRGRTSTDRLKISHRLPSRAALRHSGPAAGPHAPAPPQGAHALASAVPLRSATE